MVNTTYLFICDKCCHQTFTSDEAQFVCDHSKTNLLCRMQKNKWNCQVGGCREKIAAAAEILNFNDSIVDLATTKSPRTLSPKSRILSLRRFFLNMVQSRPLLFIFHCKAIFYNNDSQTGH